MVPAASSETVKLCLMVVVKCFWEMDESLATFCSSLCSLSLTTYFSSLESEQVIKVTFI